MTLQTIQYALLGLLSWKPLSGYDLKKIISESDLFYWSGNNNQIYNSLVPLHQDGLVSQQVEYQESLPAKKIYTITAKGEEALQAWVFSEPELPELHNHFLIQLAWADCLSGAELDALLARYEAEVEIQVRMRVEKIRRGMETPARTEREAFLWSQIHENLVLTARAELEWVRRVRTELKMRFGSAQEE
jgi:PadR family transcriptional regulator, regulatory protein AphA